MKEMQKIDLLFLIQTFEVSINEMIKMHKDISSEIEFTEKRSSHMSPSAFRKKKINLRPRIILLNKRVLAYLLILLMIIEIPSKNRLSASIIIKL